MNSYCGLSGVAVLSGDPIARRKITQIERNAKYIQALPWRSICDEAKYSKNFS